MLQVVVDQTAPLHYLLLGGVGSVSVAWGIDQEGLFREFDLQEGQFFGFAWFFAGLYEISADELVDE